MDPMHRRPCKDAARRLTTLSQGERPWNILIWNFQTSELWVNTFSWAKLNGSLCILLWQPWQANINGIYCLMCDMLWELCKSLSVSMSLCFSSILEEQGPHCPKSYWVLNCLPEDRCWKDLSCWQNWWFNSNSGCCFCGSCCHLLSHSLSYFLLFWFVCMSSEILDLTASFIDQDFKMPGPLAFIKTSR